MPTETAALFDASDGHRCTGAELGAFQALLDETTIDCAPELFAGGVRSRA